MNIREKAAQVSEKLAADELQRQKDILYTDDQFRRNGYGHYDSCPVPPVTTKDSQMTTQAPTIEFPGQSFLRVPSNFPMPTLAPTDEPTEYGVTELSPLEMVCADSQALDIVADYILECEYNATMTDDLVSAILEYIADSNNKTRNHLSNLAFNSGFSKKHKIFPTVNAIKQLSTFQSLVAKYTPEITISGGNERGQVLAVGTTAASVANAPKPPKGQSKGTKGTKAQKEKASKKTKETKELPALPVITDLAALESLDRKALQSAMSITNLHKVTGVKGNGKTVDILKALAKHLLGVDNYEPIVLSKEEKKFSIRLTRFKADGTPFTLTLDKSLWMMEILPGAIGFDGHVKALVAKSGIIELKDTTGKPEVKLELVVASQSKGGSKGKDESPLPMPEGLCWDEVKGMKYRQLQALCKVFRSNGLYQGNLAGKGVTSEHLLKSAAAAMRALGHDIQPLQVTPETPADSDNLLNLSKKVAKATAFTALAAVA